MPRSQLARRRSVPSVSGEPAPSPAVTGGCAAEITDADGRADWGVLVASDRSAWVFERGLPVSWSAAGPARTGLLRKSQADLRRPGPRARFDGLVLLGARKFPARSTAARSAGRICRWLSISALSGRWEGELRIRGG